MFRHYYGNKQQPAYQNAALAGNQDTTHAELLPEFYPFNSHVSCMTITTQQPQCIGVHTYLSRVHGVVVTSSSALRLPLTSHSGCRAKISCMRDTAPIYVISKALP